MKQNKIFTIFTIMLMIATVFAIVPTVSAIDTVLQEQTLNNSSFEMVADCEIMAQEICIGDIDPVTAITFVKLDIDTESIVGNYDFVQVGISETLESESSNWEIVLSYPSFALNGWEQFLLPYQSPNNKFFIMVKVIPRDGADVINIGAGVNSFWNGPYACGMLYGYNSGGSGNWDNNPGQYHDLCFRVYGILYENQPPNPPSTPSGPSSGNTGISYDFSTSTTDPDGDNVKYGWDWNGDGTVNEWSGFMNSGSTDTRSHSWNSAGTYHVKVKAEDEHGAQSSFSSAKTVVISDPGDTTPPTVSITNPSNGATVSGTVSVTATASDNVGVTKVEFYVDDSLKVTDTSSPYSYSWDTTSYSDSSHTVKAKAYDAANNHASDTNTVTVDNDPVNNEPPNTPSTPFGSSSGNVGTSYKYSTSTTDPDDDQVKYRFDWDVYGGHDYSDWTPLGQSGHSGSMSHSWSGSGTYTVKAQAMDKNDATSGWSSGKTVVIEGVTEPLTADAGGLYVGVKDKPVAFEGTVSGGTPPYTYKWDFGDEKTSSSQSPSHTYSKHGSYTVKLKVIDSNGDEKTSKTYASIGQKFDERYAVILIGYPGGVDLDSYLIYWHDILAAYRMYNCLTNKYGFSSGNVYVLGAKRDDLRVQEWGQELLSFHNLIMSADRDVAKSLIKYEVSEKIDKNDLLFFTYIGHGAQNKLLLNLVDHISDIELKDWTSPAVDGQVIYNIFACHSGSFIDKLSKRVDKLHTITIASSLASETTRASITYNQNFVWSSWLLDYIDGLEGAADYDQNGYFSIEEAFRYAAKKSSNDKEHPLLDDNFDGTGHTYDSNGYYDPEDPDAENLLKDGAYSSIVTLRYTGSDEESESISQPNLNPRFVKLMSLFERIVGRNLLLSILTKIIGS